MPILIPPPAYPLTLFPLQFKRQQAYPIDVDQVFYTTADRTAYLTSPRRHSGQIVADTQENKVYVLNQARDTWLPLGASPIQFQDEGVDLGTAANITTVNLTGAGITGSLDGTGHIITIDVPSPTLTVTVEDEGSSVGANVTTFNFVGAGVTATASGGVATVTVPTPTFQLHVQDEGSAIGDVTTVNLVGSGITGTVSGSVATVTVPANIILFATSADRIAYLSSSYKAAGQLGIDNEEGGVYAIAPDQTAWVDITLPKILTLTADVTLTKAHKQSMLRMNNSGPLNVTIPNDSSVNFEIGTTVIVSQTGTGAVTLVPASGVTLNTPLTLVLGMRHGKVTVTKVAANEWDVEGNLAP
jgi:hypothetical protein